MIRKSIGNLTIHVNIYIDFDLLTYVPFMVVVSPVDFSGIRRAGCWIRNISYLQGNIVSVYCMYIAHSM